MPVGYKAGDTIEGTFTIPGTFAQVVGGFHGAGTGFIIDGTTNRISWTSAALGGELQEVVVRTRKDGCLITPSPTTTPTVAPTTAPTVAPTTSPTMMPSYGDCSLDPNRNICKEGKTAICIESINKSFKKITYETKCVDDEKVTTYELGVELPTTSKSKKKKGRSSSKTLYSCGCCIHDDIQKSFQEEYGNDPTTTVEEYKLKNEDADYCPASSSSGGDDNDTTDILESLYEHSNCSSSSDEGIVSCGTTKDGDLKYPVCFEHDGHEHTKCIAMDKKAKSDYIFQKCGCCDSEPDLCL